MEPNLDRGHTNGVKNLRIVGTEELRQMEPTLDEECTAALLSPDAGTLIPYEYTIALAENAADNGVEVRVRLAVDAEKAEKRRRGKSARQLLRRPQRGGTVGEVPRARQGQTVGLC